MFDYFGFDPSKMSDQELLTKVTDLQAKLVYAARFSSPDMIGNLQLLLRNIEFERTERLNRRLWAEQQKQFPDVIESEPDLARDGPSKSEPEKKIKTRPDNAVRIVKTQRPVVEDPNKESE